jgi:hypothetical protein
MSSMFRVFPDAHALLSLHPEDLAYQFLPYFRSLPWQIRSGVLSCVSLSVQRYPREVRAPLLDALMSAWAFLHHEGMLGTAERPPHVAIRLCCLSIPTSGLGTPPQSATQRGAR